MASTTIKVQGPVLKEALLTQVLAKFPLSCMPVIAVDRPGLGKWVTRAVSFALFSTSNKAYEAICYRDVKFAALLMNSIAAMPAASWPIEEKAFLLHKTLSYIIGYRSTDYFRLHPGVTIPLPVQEDTLVLKPCVFEQEINIFGGVMVKVFVPQDGVGSPTYVFSGTTPWNCADGAGIGLLDDVNPLGPGQGLRLAARVRLAKHLTWHKLMFKYPAILVGHSLGAILSTALAVDLPELVSMTVAFSPALPARDVWERWKVLKAANRDKPISSFLPRYKGRWDIISYIGSRWIGNAYCVDYAHPADFVYRHTSVNLGQARSTQITSLNTTPCTWRGSRLHGLLYGLSISPVAVTLLFILCVKRFAVGWNQGGRWRWGVMGILAGNHSKWICSFNPKRY